MRTFPRHIPPDSPRGDYAAFCAYCGAKFHRSELRLDAGNRLYCPQEGDGLDDVALDEIAAATELPYEEPVAEELHHIPRDEYDQPPVILTEPADATVEEGETASFAVTYTGDNVTVQWDRRNADTDFEPLAGATEDEYELVAVAEDSGARFRARLSNGSGHTVTRSAILSVPSWSPLQLGANLFAWWGGSAVEEDGLVATWVDLSGNGRSPTIVSPAARPMLIGSVAALGGLPALLFSGSQRLEFAPFELEQPYTLYTVVNITAANGSDRLIVSGTSSVGQVWRSTTGNGVFMYNGASVGFSSLTQDQSAIIRVTADGANSSIRVIKSGSDVTSSLLNPGAGDLVDVAVGALVGGGANWIGYIAQVIYLDVDFRDDEDDDMIPFLMPYIQ